MEAKTIKLPMEKYVLYFLGDVHEGAANHNTEAFRKAVALIKKDKAAWVGMGDYIDCINHMDPRFNPQEISEKYCIKDLDDLPRKQSDNFLKAVDGIKDQCIGLIYGNHEDSYHKHNTFDVVDYMSEKMGVTNLRHKACISLAFYKTESKSIPIKLWVLHGKGGGGMREGYPVNKSFDVFRWVMGDCCVMGHLHQMVVRRAEYTRYEHNSLRQDPVWFGVNGCFLMKSTEGNDGYFEQAAGMESSVGMLKLTILPSADMLKPEFKTTLEMVYI